MADRQEKTNVQQAGGQDLRGRNQLVEHRGAIMRLVVYI